MPVELMSRPRIGELCGLVYRECPCGNWCATGEGNYAPLCGGCGEMMMPGGGAAGQFGPQDGSDPNYGRRARGLGFVALLTNEIEGFVAVSRVKGLLGITAAQMVHGVRPSARHYSEQEIRSQIDQVRASVTPSM